MVLPRTARASPTAQHSKWIDGAEGKTITVGSKNFTEQFIVAEEGL